MKHKINRLLYTPGLLVIPFSAYRLATFARTSPPLSNRTFLTLNTGLYDVRSNQHVKRTKLNLFMLQALLFLSKNCPALRNYDGFSEVMGRLKIETTDVLTGDED